MPKRCKRTGRASEAELSGRSMFELLHHLACSELSTLQTILPRQEEHYIVLQCL